MTTTSGHPSVDRTAGWLAGLLAVTSTLHFVVPRRFDPAVPGWLPGSRLAWEVGSGVAELGCAVLLAVPRTRRLGGYASAVLFVGVFPGNLDMVRTARTPAARFLTLLRLPLQAPLVSWAWRVGRGASAR